MSKKLKSGVVALIGRPNVGKSTLLNAFLKDEISIVTPKAQTTRDQVRGIVTEERGQVVFVDTPGVHRALEGGINAYMIQEVKHALEEPDLILYLIDPFSKVSSEQVLLDHLKHVKSRLIVLVNKEDLRKKRPDVFRWLPEWFAEIEKQLSGSQCSYLGVRNIAAARNKGVKELLSEVFELLPTGPFLYAEADALTDRSTRFVVSELIRKTIA